jgi:NAD(P)-dependent dehydrogenase (short-subunit alcohol dehydrogenase family)
MSGRIEGKVAAVTGAGGGIGRGVCAAFAKEGAAIVAIDVSLERAQVAAKVVTDLGGRAVGLACDVSDAAAYRAALKAGADQLGDYEILVQAAQGFGNAKSPAATPVLIPLEDYPEEDFDFSLQTGLLASFRGTKAIFPYFRRVGRGKIINFASGWGLEGYAGAVAYNACKEGIRGLTRSTAREWGQYKITANCICPAAWTPAFAAYKESNPEQFAQRLATIPVGRHADPELDIGRSIVFLASEESDMMTGMTFMIDGGLLMRA